MIPLSLGSSVRVRYKQLPRWLCPQGSTFLYVRNDKQSKINLTISHDAFPLGDTTRLRHEFDWTGTQTSLVGAQSLP